jgi:flagellar motor switch protein FliN/FliY
MVDEEKVNSQVETPATPNEAVPPSPDSSAPAAGGEAQEVATMNKPEDDPKQKDASSDMVANPNDAAVESSGEISGENSEEDMMAMLEDLPAENNGTKVDDIDFDSASVANAEFQHLSESAGKSEPRNIDLLMDVSLPLSIELGRTKMPIAEVLGLGPGSVVELNKLAGEPVDVLVNQKIIAKGEVVVIDENFGVRITQLMTPAERLKMLSEDE